MRKVVATIVGFILGLGVFLLIEKKRNELTEIPLGNGRFLSGYSDEAAQYSVGKKEFIEELYREWIKSPNYFYR